MRVIQASNAPVGFEVVDNIKDKVGALDWRRRERGRGGGGCGAVDATRHRLTPPAPAALSTTSSTRFPAFSTRSSRPRRSRPPRRRASRSRWAAGRPGGQAGEGGRRLPLVRLQRDLSPRCRRRRALTRRRCYPASPALALVCLQGEFITGVGRGTKPSINVELRKALGLFANVVHSFNMPGIPSRCVRPVGAAHRLARLPWCCCLGCCCLRRGGTLFYAATYPCPVRRAATRTWTLSSSARTWRASSAAWSTR